RSGAHVLKAARLNILLATLLALSAPVHTEEPLPERIEFNRHIRPILSDNCFLCHGPDRNTREAGLRLDLRAEATQEREGHRAIAAGDAAASILIQRIISDDPDDRMPPADSNRHVSPRELEL